MNDKVIKKNVFITGATSFLGRNTCSYLISKGYNVFALVREFSDNNDKLKNIAGLHIIPMNIDSISKDEIESFIDIDDNSNIPHKLLFAIKKIKKSNNIFIHYAWNGTHRLDRDNKEMQESNLSQSKKWLKFARALSVNKFIFAGSQAEYSYSYYGIFKNKFAEYAKEYLNNKMFFVHMRIFSVFGNDDRKTTILSALLNSIKDNKDFDMTSCRKIWNFLYIDDYKKIIEKIVRKTDILSDKNNMIDIDVASDDTRPLREYVRQAHKSLSSKIKLNFGVKDENSDIFAIPNITPLINYIGKIKFTDFDVAIKNMYKYI